MDCGAGERVRAGNTKGGLRPPFNLGASVVARPHGGAVLFHGERGKGVRGRMIMIGKLVF